MYDIVIVGAGGFAREVFHWAKSSFAMDKYQIKGFLSNNPRDLDDFNIDLPILGDPCDYIVKKQDRFLFAIGDVDVKRKMIEKLKERGAEFLTLIHPTAVVVDTAKIGEGVILCPFTLVSDHVEIGDFVLMNIYSSCGHDVKLGEYSVLSPYATLNGWVITEEEAFLGSHATVVARKRVGKGAKISANSVAMRHVPAHSLVYGVPGKVTL